MASTQPRPRTASLLFSKAIGQARPRLGRLCQETRRGLFAVAPCRRQAPIQARTVPFDVPPRDDEEHGRQPCEPVERVAHDGPAVGSPRLRGGQPVAVHREPGAVPSKARGTYTCTVRVVRTSTGGQTQVSQVRRLRGKASVARAQDTCSMQAGTQSARGVGA